MSYMGITMNIPNCPCCGHEVKRSFDLPGQDNFLVECNKCMYQANYGGHIKICEVMARECIVLERDAATNEFIISYNEITKNVDKRKNTQIITEFAEVDDKVNSDAIDEISKRINIDKLNKLIAENVERGFDDRD